jgi:hypothetical protein
MTETIHKFKKAITDLFDDRMLINKYSITESDLNDKRPVKPKKFRMRNQTSSRSLARQSPVFSTFMAYSKTIILRAVLTGTTLFSAYGCVNEKKEAANREKREDLKSEDWAKKDAVFLAKAAEINIAEIRLGQLAEKQSINSDVLDLGMALVHPDGLLVFLPSHS